MDPDEVAAGCFEFRLRTRSFDLHQLAHGSKLKKFGRLFRTPSEGGVKGSSSGPPSPATSSSPRQSPPRRRRFVRVVRDKQEDCSEDGRFVVHKYSESFLAQMNRERFVVHMFVHIEMADLGNDSGNVIAKTILKSLRPRQDLSSMVSGPRPRLCVNKLGCTRVLKSWFRDHNPG